MYSGENWSAGNSFKDIISDLAIFMKLDIIKLNLLSISSIFEEDKIGCGEIAGVEIRCEIGSVNKENKKFASLEINRLFSGKEIALIFWNFVIEIDGLGNSILIFNWKYSYLFAVFETESFRN